MTDYLKRYDEYLNFTEKSIDYYLDKLNCNPVLKKGMSYSVKAGGKRIRPVMFFALLDTLGVDYKKYGAFGCAIEFIHAYSLIHDDLPAMDNDDFRRGKPSNHKVFGEGIAILCGDALLNYAFEICANAVCDKNTFLAYKYLLSCSGPSGMVDGQAYDLYCERHPEEKFGYTEEQLLDKIHVNKTGKLLTAPLVMAGHIANREIAVFETLGDLTGKLFQFTDDLLDVESSFEKLGKTPGKDAKTGKLSAVSVYGIEGCKKHIQNYYSKIEKIIKTFENNSFFYDFYLNMKNRLN